MALTKRTYVDGETIITAQNLNDIQDEIISLGNNTVPKTRTVNGKALSGNVTLNAGDIGYSSSAAYSAGTVGDTLKNEKSRLLTLSDATEIPASSNFDTYTTIGDYYVATTANARTITNIPLAVAGRLVVMSGIEPNSNYKKQIFIPYYGSTIFVRHTANNGSSWSTWDSTAQSSDLLYKSGDTLTNEWLYAFGWLQGSGKTIALYVFLPKSMNGLTMNVSEVILQMRQADGSYMPSQSYDGTSLVSAVNGRGYQVGINITDTTAYGNNGITMIGQVKLSATFT